MPNNSSGNAYIPQPFVDFGLTDPVSQNAFSEINRLITFGGDAAQQRKDDTAFNRDIANLNADPNDTAFQGGIANAMQARDIQQLAGKRAIKDQAASAFEAAAIPAAQKDKALSYDKWIAEQQTKQAKRARDTQTAAQIAAIVAMIAIAAA